MKIDFTDAELETIAAAMDDYIAYDDPDASPEDCLLYTSDAADD